MVLFFSSSGIKNENCFNHIERKTKYHGDTAPIPSAPLKFGGLLCSRLLSKNGMEASNSFSHISLS